MASTVNVTNSRTYQLTLLESYPNLDQEVVTDNRSTVPTLSARWLIWNFTYRIGKFNFVLRNASLPR
ncbi:hypothetical protein VP150E351_P0158 [Vibrio phage 150E35-1]|nr:hypothetical protein VP150E351_P0158 [Vibrio phage 150E35-1]